MIRTCYLLEQLSADANNHIPDAEKAMRLHSFPRLTEHIREHRESTNRLYWMRKAFLIREVTSELMIMLRN